MATHLRPLSFGEILDGAFTLYRRHPLSLFVAALLGGVPMTLAMLYFLGESVVRPGAVPDPVAALAAAGVVAIAFPLQWAALTRMSAQAYTGGPVSVGDGYRAGARAWAPMVGAGVVIVICLFIAIFALGIAIGIFGAVFGAVAQSPGVAVGVAVLAVVGSVAFYLVCIALLFAVVPAIVVEGKGPLGAVGRSVELARGALGRVIGVGLVGWLIVMLPSIAAMILTGGTASLLDPEAAAVPSPRQFMVQQLLGLVAYVATLPFLTAALVLLYYDRRARLEAHDLEGLVEGLSTAR